MFTTVTVRYVTIPMTPQPLDPCVLEGLLEETATLKDAQDKSETLGLTEDFYHFPHTTS